VRHELTHFAVPHVVGEAVQIVLLRKADDLHAGGLEVLEKARKSKSRAIDLGVGDEALALGHMKHLKLKLFNNRL
jgi:hypothetical protein